VVILLLGYLYFRLAGEAYALVAIGLISFAAVAQFAPAMIGGMYWRGGTRGGALAGLSAGFLVWAYTLLLPSFAKSGWLPDDFLTQGLFGIELLRPQQLFGLTGIDEIAHCLFWSFFANIGAYVGFSCCDRRWSAEATQATVFVDALKETGPVGAVLWRGRAKVSDLQELVGRFLGPARAQAAICRLCAPQRRRQRLKARGRCQAGAVRRIAVGRRDRQCFGAGDGGLGGQGRAA
jgi:hypothetical protein